MGACFKIQDFAGEVEVAGFHGSRALFVGGGNGAVGEVATSHDVFRKVVASAEGKHGL